MGKALRYQLIDLARGTDSLGLLKKLREWQYENADLLELKNLGERDDYFNELRRIVPTFRDVRNFEDLPIIDKAFINDHRDELINKQYQGRLFRKKTGGSTGEPLIYFTGAESQSYLWAGLYLAWEIAGYRFGDRIAFLAGPSLFSSGFKQTIYFKLLRVTLMSAYNMTPKSLSEYGQQLQNGDIRLLYGYPSAIHLLARHYLDQGKTLTTTLRGIVCTAERLTPAMRFDIETAFGVPCFSQYGCHDAGVSAFECEHRNGFHLISSRNYWEVLPNGELVSTDLSNRAMFMPRYNTGDIVKLSSRACPCGRGFPLLEDVLGRRNDMVVDTCGTTVHSLFFDSLFREDLGIRSFQVLFDESVLYINLHVKSINDETRKEMEAKYLAIINKTLVFDEVRIVYNEPFLSLINGKHSFIMRKPRLASVHQLHPTEPTDLDKVG